MVERKTRKDLGTKEVDLVRRDRPRKGNRGWVGGSRVSREEVFSEKVVGLVPVINGIRDYP